MARETVRSTAAISDRLKSEQLKPSMPGASPPSARSLL
jgi:hypothetical protein